MVLVNGSEGTGPAGWSSFIPNYNPRDIICNLKRLLKGEAMVPMLPWYKGFKGNIQKASSEDTQYTTTGIYNVTKDENALSITELPVRQWTQDYKDFLDAASQDGKDNNTPFIKAYTAGYDAATMHFEIFMTQDQMNTAEQEGFVKKFKLTNTLSTANMHLFDANGVIKKYDTPEQILKEFFDLRLKFYEKRRTALLCELEKAVWVLENKLRFISLISREKICLVNRKIDEVCEELKSYNFKPLPKERVEDPITEYDYLLSIRSALMSTYEKKREYRKELVEKKKQFGVLTNTLPEDLWLKDLAALEHQLNKGYAASDSDNEEPQDMKRKKQGKASRKRKQQDKDDDESSPEIAAEAPKKNAPAKRAAARPQKGEEDGAW